MRKKLCRSGVLCNQFKALKELRFLNEYLIFLLTDHKSAKKTMVRKQAEI